MASTRELIRHQEREPSPTLSSTFDYAAHADAKNTQRSYLADWKHFLSWCRQRNVCPLPADPDNLALYARVCVMTLKLKLSTLRRRMAAISQAHSRNNYDSPTKEWVVKKTLQRLSREFGKPAQGKDPLLVEDLIKMLSLLPKSLAGTRDKAILLLGFAGGMRRSEVVALNIEDLQIADQGLIVKINRGKTDQYGQGRKIGIPYGANPLTCPVKAVLKWLDESKLETGPLFRGVNKFGRPAQTRLTDQVVYQLVKKWSKKAGKNPAAFGAHSLRVGLVTQATIGGATEREIQNQTGHRSLMVLRRNIGPLVILASSSQSSSALTQQARGVVPKYMDGSLLMPLIIQFSSPRCL